MPRHTLPELGYGYDALEPYIDEQTMRIHHTKHHQAYIDKLNAAISGHPELAKLSVEQLLKDINKVPDQIRQAVINHGGGHANHAFFWQILKKDAEPGGKVLHAINDVWGTFEKFREELATAGANRFGSGWAWLVLKGGKLDIISTPNQDSPLLLDAIPLLGIDVWEHAYYLKYQSRRNEYIAAFFNVINWEKVEEYYQDALKGG